MANNDGRKDNDFGHGGMTEEEKKRAQRKGRQNSNRGDNPDMKE
jgi:hypothetical protein